MRAVLGLCLLEARFSRAQHLADIAAVTKLFQSRGFHAVKVTTDFEVRGSRRIARTGTVAFTVHVSERRQADVVFQGNDPNLFPESALRGHFTFDEAGSVDDFEIEASATAIQRYYQAHGHFDAQVTYKRESTQLVDHVFFFVEEGPTRDLKGISFAAVDGDGKLAIAEADLRGHRRAAHERPLFGGGAYVSPTAEALADDANRIRRLYVQDGYGDARVAVRVGPDPDTPRQPLRPRRPGRRRSRRPRPVPALRHPAGRAHRARRGRGRLRRRAPRHLRRRVRPARRQHRQQHPQSGAPERRRVDSPGLAVPTRPANLEAAGAKLKDWFWSLGRPRAEAQLWVVKANAGNPAPLDRDGAPVGAAPIGAGHDGRVPRGGRTRVVLLRRSRPAHVVPQ